MGVSCSDGVEEICKPDYCDDKGGGSPFICKPRLSPKKVACHDDEASAFFWCQAMGGTARQPICNGVAGGGTTDTGDTGNTETDGEDESWSPSAHVTFDARHSAYFVDADFIAALEANPALLTQDNAYVTSTESGYYQLHAVTKGDFAYALGLRTGDVLQDLNGHELQTLDRILDAYDDLEHEQEFILTVERGADPVQLNYVLVAP